MIDADNERMAGDRYDEPGDELDLAASDSLPWLESDGGDDAPVGFDIVQIIAFGALLVAIFGGVLGAVWFFTNRAESPELVADGSVIAAPAGPIKERPADPGGKEFEGTGNIAPVVGEGGQRPAVMAGGDPVKPAKPSASATPPALPAASPAATPAPPTAKGIGIQLAAYSTRARAEEGWSQISRRTDALGGVAHRVVEGKVDIGTVYRLQAVAATRAEADRLCAALKADGLDCQVKP